MVSKRKKKRPEQSKLGHVQVSDTQDVPMYKIMPSIENDELYRPVDPEDPTIQQLAVSIREIGLLEPLVLTKDYFILSGHRRFAAAELAGLDTVRCRFEDFDRGDDIDRFVLRLREYNRQRDKTLDEKLREELVSVNADEAYESLVAHRSGLGGLNVEAMKIEGRMKRSRISDAKQPFLDAALDVIWHQQPDFWPLTVRRIHYAILNDPPLKHARKPNSVYANDRKSYQDLCNLLTRARLEGLVPWESISDETRPVATWNTHDDPRSFIRDQLDEFLKGYWRNLQISQPHHMEIVGEKNTVDPIIRPVAAEFCIPFTTGRGFCSLEPRRKMFERYERSGKNKLVLLLLSDFDPDGEEIAQSFARSMRDDFGIADIHPVRVALTAELVAQNNLPPKMKAKKGSSNHKKFTDKYGSDDVWELEALQPAVLQSVLRDAIDCAIDVEAFNAELNAEKQDAAFLQGMRNTVSDSLKELDWGNGSSNDELN